MQKEALPVHLNGATSDGGMFSFRMSPGGRKTSVEFMVIEEKGKLLMSNNIVQALCMLSRGWPAQVNPPAQICQSQAVYTDSPQKAEQFLIKRSRIR